jgi:hypothetical protein
MSIVPPVWPPPDVSADRSEQALTTPNSKTAIRDAER